MKKQQEKQQEKQSEEEDQASEPQFLNPDDSMHKQLEENPEAKAALIRQADKSTKVKYH